MSTVLDLNFAERPTMTDIKSGVQAVVTRTTLGAFEDRNGYMRFAQNGEPRFHGAEFDHNLAWYTYDMSVAGWNPNGADVTPQPDMDPPAGVNSVVQELRVDTAGGSVVAAIQFSFNNTTPGYGRNGDIVVFSCYMKAGSVNYGGPYVVGITGGNAARAKFDLVNGTDAPGYTQNSYKDQYGIEDAGDGWWRVWATKDFVADHTGNFYIMVNEDAVSDSTTRDGTSYVYVCGPAMHLRSGDWDSMNLITDSNSLETATTLAGGSVADNQIANPADGAIDAALFTEDTSTGGHNMYKAFTQVAGRRYAHSVFLKSNGRDIVSMYQSGTNHAEGRSWRVDLSDGTLNNGDSNYINIQAAGNGWYRVTYWGEATAAGGGLAWIAGYSGSGSYTGDGTSGFYAWGWQVAELKPGEFVPRFAATSGGAVENYSPRKWYPTTSTVIATYPTSQNEGLMSEADCTNLLLQSEDLSTTWGLSSAAVVTNVARGIDGANTMDRLEDDGLGGTGQLFAAQTVTVATSTSYTYSAYLKKGSLDWGLLWVNGFTTPASGGVYFDLANGAVGTADTGITGGIEDKGNGLYRCWITFTTDAVDTAGDLRVYGATADNNPTVTKDGTNFIYVGHQQFETTKVSLRPSSYIRTTTGTGTRNSDDMYILTANWLPEKWEGTIYTEFTKDATPSTSSWLWSLSNNGSSNRLYNYYTGANTINLALQSGGVSQGGINGPANATADGEINRNVVLFSEAGKHMYHNGSPSPAEDTTADTPPTVTRLCIGSFYNAGGGHFEGLLRRITWSDTRISDERADQLSAGTLSVDNALDVDYVRNRKLSRDRWRSRYRRS